MSNGLIKRATRERPLWMHPLHCCVHQIMRSPETATVSPPLLPNRTCWQYTCPPIDHIVIQARASGETCACIHIQIQSACTFHQHCCVCRDELSFQLSEQPHVLSLRCVRQHCRKRLTYRHVTFSRNNEPSAGTRLFQSSEKWDFFFFFSLPLSMTQLLSWSLNLLK